MFADHGAEVIKVRAAYAAARPSALRGPFKDELPDPETGGVHLYLNTNKLGVTLNLGDDRTRDLLFKLLNSADILLKSEPAGGERPSGYLVGVRW